MWQLYGHEFLTLALIHFMAVILPGPDFVITVRQSVRYGYLIGCLTAIGIGVGISVHVFYTLVGIGFLIQQSEWLMSLIRTAGAAYLVYLGWQCLRASRIPILKLMAKQVVTRQVYLKLLRWVFLPMR